MIITTSFACIFDMGLVCVPTAIAIFLFPALGIWLKKKFKWCKKSCGCGCHNKPLPKEIPTIKK